MLQTRTHPFESMKSELKILEFNDAWEVVSRKQIFLDGLTLVHDFCFTDDYYIIVRSSIKFSNMYEFLTGSKSAWQCLDFDEEEPCKVFFVPRKYERRKWADPWA